MSDINVSQQSKQRPDRHGANNPMYGRTHSQESRNKMSQAATLRNQEYKKWKDSQHHITMDEFLSNNPSVEEYIKQLAKKVVKEQIDKLIWNSQRRISIPNI